MYMMHNSGMDQLHSSVIVLIIELGEVFRRAMWAVYRIEWEVRISLFFVYYYYV